MTRHSTIVLGSNLITVELLLYHSLNLRNAYVCVAEVFDTINHANFPTLVIIVVIYQNKIHTIFNNPNRAVTYASCLSSCYYDGPNIG